MESKCSFANRGVAGCGDFRGCCETIKLSECTADVDAHLHKCHLLKLVGKITEDQLILSRAGMFDISPQQQAGMWICQKHRHNLGRNWRALRTCQYPLHAAPKKQHAKKRVVNLEMSRAARLLFGVTVPVGARKFDLFIYLPIHFTITLAMKCLPSPN